MPATAHRKITMSNIKIIPVDGIRTFISFCKLPRVIYREMQGFAPSLDVERWTLYSHRLNPHFKQVEAQEFLAEINGKYVGRVEAHVYKPEINPVGVSRHQFGSLDAIDDINVVSALMSTAEDWLRRRGASTIYGPFSPSINGECGVLVDGFRATPMIFMPWHPPYISRHLAELGYIKAKDLISYRYDAENQDLAQKPRISTRKEWASRIKVRPLDFSNLKTKETQLLTDLFNEAWGGNWGFVPFTKSEFDSTADALKLIMPREYGFVVELDGSPVSFAIALPNIYEITTDLDGKLFPTGLFKLLSRIRNHKFKSARMVMLGTKKKLQNSATGGVVLLTIVEELRARAQRISTTHLEAGWILEDNMSMRKPIEMFGAKIDKVHRIYEKRI